MLFCPDCGSIMKAKQKTMICSCGFSTKSGEAKVTEKINNPGTAIDIIDQEIETNPEVNETCSKCNHPTATFWFVQTRAGDEPATKFLKCKKCKHTWREY